jgi:hypothetical protein
MSGAKSVWLAAALTVRVACIVEPSSKDIEIDVVNSDFATGALHHV